MIETHTRGVVLDRGDGGDLTEAPRVPPHTHAAVAVESVLTGGAVLADVGSTVIGVLRTVLAGETARAFTPATNVGFKARRAQPRLLLFWCMQGPGRPMVGPDCWGGFLLMFEWMASGAQL